MEQVSKFNCWHLGSVCFQGMEAFSRKTILTGSHRSNNQHINYRAASVSNLVYYRVNHIQQIKSVNIVQISSKKGVCVSCFSPNLNEMIINTFINYILTPCALHFLYLSASRTYYLLIFLNHQQ